MDNLNNNDYDILSSICVISMRLVIDPNVDLSKPMNMGEKMKLNKLWGLI